MPPAAQFDFSDLPDKGSQAAPAASGFDFSDLPDKPTGPQKSKLEQFKEKRKKIAEENKGYEPVRDLVVGAGKSVLNTVATLASPIRKAMGRFAGPGGKPQEFSNTTQRVGGMAEQVGEFFLPEVGAGKVVEALPEMGKLARVATKAGLTGLGTAGVAKAQGDSHPAVAGVLGASGPVLEGIGPQAFKWLRTSAKESLAKAFGATDIGAKPEFARTVKKVVPLALDEGIKPTWRAWLSQRNVARGQAGQSLEKFLEGPGGGTLVPVKPVIEALDELANTSAKHVMRAEETLKGANGPVTGQVVDTTVTYNRRLLKHVEELKSTLAQYGDVVPARTLHDLKQSWNEFVYQADQFPNQSKLKLALEKKAKLAAIDGVRSVLDQSAPKLADLDKAYHLNRTLYDVVRKAATGEEAGEVSQKVASRTSSTLARKLAPAGGGAVVGGSYGFERRHSLTDAAVGAIVGGVSGRMLQAAITSPAFRMGSAQMKNQLAEAIANGNAEQVRRIITPFLVRGTEARP